MKQTYHRLDRSISRIAENTSSSSDKWIAGYIITPHGIVGVYADSREFNPQTELTLAVAGVRHTRLFHQYFSARRIVTLATRFAREVDELAHP